MAFKSRRFNPIRKNKTLKRHRPVRKHRKSRGGCGCSIFSS